MEKAGLGKHDRSNIIYLPKCRDNHPARTVHDGSHPGYSNSVDAKLAALEKYGGDNNWTNAQYKDAVFKVLAVGRAELRLGETRLNKNSVPPNC